MILSYFISFHFILSYLILSYHLNSHGISPSPRTTTAPPPTKQHKFDQCSSLDTQLSSFKYSNCTGLGTIQVLRNSALACPKNAQVQHRWRHVQAHRRSIQLNQRNAQVHQSSIQPHRRNIEHRRRKVQGHRRIVQAHRRNVQVPKIAEHLAL